MHGRDITEIQWTKLRLVKPGDEYRPGKTNTKSIHVQISDLENESHDAQLLSFSKFGRQGNWMWATNSYCMSSVFLACNLQTRYEDLLQLSIPPFCQFPSYIDNRGCHGPSWMHPDLAVRGHCRRTFDSGLWETLAQIVATMPNEIWNLVWRRGTTLS